MLLKRDIEIRMPLEDSPGLECSPPFTEKGVRLDSGKGRISEKWCAIAGYLTTCSRPLLSLIPLRRRRIPQSLNLQHAICRKCRLITYRLRNITNE